MLFPLCKAWRNFVTFPTPYSPSIALALIELGLNYV